MGLLIIRAGGGGGGSQYPRSKTFISQFFGALASSCCSAGRSEGCSIQLYVGVAGCTSNSNATLEPKYRIPEFAAAITRNGWIVGRGGVLDTIGNPTIAFDANRYRPEDTDKDLLARNFGSGASAIIGMELSVSRLKMSIETDLLQL
ncbi:MAG: hypothetical protein LBI30_00715, partial [Holosporales bacterium]|nr:hypothetical protein [Holosporales bacterium]